MNEKFTNDLKKIYELVSERQKELGNYFVLLQNEDKFPQMREFIDEFLKSINLEITKENRLSALSRLITLRDEQLVQSLNQADFSDEVTKIARETAYLWVKEFYLKRHNEFLTLIEKDKLLNEFYRTLLRGVHDIGTSLSQWQSTWNSHIINTINPELQERFGEQVMDYLYENDLFDKDEEGNVTDRAYSVLNKCDDGYESYAYAKFFHKEVSEVVDIFDKLLQKLQILEDNDTNQKEAYINYMRALKDAFGEKDTCLLLKRWQEVDRTWMSVTSAIQVGHPLEYYEDHYRKAVALEWDVRISNPQNLGAARTCKNILYMYNTLYKKLSTNGDKVLNLTLDNLKRVGLYIGRPTLYYAAEFNGLFSAQVVPNDELVTNEKGKKIFAFADNILDSLRAKPFLKIQNTIFGKDFLNHERELVFKKADIWHEVYEVTTIGHEYGHILWLDNDTESQMNKSGVFKNIEEFKATMGGLMAFFMSESDDLKEYVLNDVIKRSIGLIAWMKTGEVEPYYCEGLIHLSGLFETGVLKFEDTLKIDNSPEAYERIKQWYIKTYESLASHYLAKKDANLFLSKYAQKEDGSYLPLDINVKYFVNYYWNLHQSIGRDIDENETLEDWL